MNKEDKKEYYKRYYRENKEKIKKSQKERYKNDEQYRESLKEKARLNSDYNKRYYRENKERLKKKRKQKYRENIEKYREENRRRYREKYAVTRVYKKVENEEDRKKRDNERKRKWREKNKDKENEKQRLYREKNKKKSGKIGRPKTRYILDSKLRYEIILSQGKGEATHKLKMMLYKICYNLNKKFFYKNEDMRYDIMMNSYLDIMNGWMNFNNEKYKKALPFVSEIIKRSHAKWFNDHVSKGMQRYKKDDRLHFENIEI